MASFSRVSVLYGGGGGGGSLIRVLYRGYVKAQLGNG